jgi:Vanadium chloroperoxidase N-terminal domain/PAP2 superfamily
MKLRLATILVLATALVLSTFSVLSTTAPAQAAPPDDPDTPETPWPIDDVRYRPGPNDNVILKWNEELLQAIRLHPPTTGPTITARALGVLHTATYDAWAAYDPVAKGTRLGSQLRRPAAERTLENKNKAISFAAYKVLIDLFPVGPRYPRIGEVDFAAQMAELGYKTDGSDTSTAAMVGNTAAQAVLDYRHTDGSNQLNGYGDTTGYQPTNTWDKVKDPWHWQPLCVPLPPAGATTCGGSVQSYTTPQWKDVKAFSPFTYQITGPARTPSGAYSTAEIQQAYKDTSDLTDKGKVTAEYWADGPRTEFPPGHLAVFAQVLSRKRGHTVDTDAKMFFTLGNAMMDASIAAWWAKYKWDFVRPTTAIREFYKGQTIRSWLGPYQGYGDVLGENWRPYQAPSVVTPPFPEYVSGHSTFSAAGTSVLNGYTQNSAFGASVTIKAGSSLFEPKTDEHPTDYTPTTDITLSWPTFNSAATEAGMSRRYGGIHFKSGDEHGRMLGSQVASFVYSKAQNYITGRTPG